MASRTGDVGWRIALSATSKPNLQVSNPSTVLRYDIIFTGRVQGVWFRATTQDVAREFDVAGWVRNESDGSVRCVAEGVAGELDRFVVAVQEAKQSNIDNTNITQLDATGEFTSFSIRY